MPLAAYPPNFLDIYEGYLKTWVLLANAFVDLGTWNCFTPFVGFGIGGAHVQLADFSDVNPSTGGFGFGRNSSKWNLAWALHAGVAYEVSKNLKIDLSYRYLNYGSVTDTVDCNGGCNRGFLQVRQSSIRTTSCSACAGPAATPRRRRRVTSIRRRRRSTRRRRHHCAAEGEARVTCNESADVRRLTAGKRGENLWLIGA